MQPGNGAIHLTAGFFLDPEGTIFQIFYSFLQIQRISRIHRAHSGQLGKVVESDRIIFGCILIIFLVDFRHEHKENLLLISGQRVLCPLDQVITFGNVRAKADRGVLPFRNRLLFLADLIIRKDLSN